MRAQYLQNKLNCLIQLFSQFGPIRCTYIPSHVSLDDGFAHVTFHNSADALSAWNAGQRREVAVEGELLTLTLVSDDEEPIKVLNDDCLIQIFLMLDGKSLLAVEKVCKHWEKLAMRSWFTTNYLTFRAHCNLETIEEYVVRCGKFLTVIDFPIMYQLSRSSLSLVGNYCQNITRMTISLNHDDIGADEFSEEFSAILSRMKHLKELDLKNIDENFRFDFVDNLSADMDRIWFSANCDNPQESGPISLALDLSKFCNLTYLILNNFVIDEGALKGLKRLENLIFLNFVRSRVHYSVVETVEHLTKLECLYIPNCQIQDNVLLSIIANNRELEILDISCIQRLTDRSLMAISRLPKLEQLGMSGLPDIKLNFMDEMPLLEELHCDDSVNVEEEALRKIVKTSPKLKFLDITGCPVTDSFFDFANSTMDRTNGFTLKIKTTSLYTINEENKSPFLIIDSPDFSSSSDDDDDTPMIMAMMF